MSSMTFPNKNLLSGLLVAIMLFSLIQERFLSSPFKPANQGCLRSYLVDGLLEGLYSMHLIKRSLKLAERVSGSLIPAKSTTLFLAYGLPTIRAYSVIP